MIGSALIGVTFDSNTMHTLLVSLEVVYGREPFTLCCSSTTMLVADVWPIVFQHVFSIAYHVSKTALVWLARTYLKSDGHLETC